MSLITIKSVSVFIAERCIFDDISWGLHAREKVALVGRNGQGKSTLLQLLAGMIQPDSGEVMVQSGAKIKLLNQAVPKDKTGTVFDVVAEGVGELGKLLVDYQACLTSDNIEKAVLISEQIENLDGWSIHHKINTIITRLNLKAEVDVNGLSGGMKRRVMLAQALACEPDLLLLDEPTNHLDMESIEWLEAFLQQYQGALIVVSHDREFMQKVSKNIVEIDRGVLHDYSGGYENYLRLREQRLNEEERHNALFDKNLNQEEQWIRQGVKARRTRNEGRVRALKQLRLTRSQRVDKQATVKGIKISNESSGTRVIHADKVSFSYEGKSIISDFSIELQRGDKLGIIGPNGCGKTTLLKLMLGQLQAQKGAINLGTRLQIAYFDQLRNELDEHLTVMDNVAQGSTQVTVNGKTKHVASYLRDFLFTPQQLNQTISKLSGGERNRLLLAKLFAKPCNVLVMDEPTNDLDVETLEMLEALLVDFSGTLLLVSHDRQFIDNVVTSVLVYRQEVGFDESLGGYSEYARALEKESKQTSKASTPASKQNSQQAALKPKVKLSYNQQRELEQLPLKIEQLETELEKIHQEMASPDFYQQPSDLMTKVQSELKSKENQLSECYQRWEELEGA